MQLQTPSRQDQGDCFFIPLASNSVGYVRYFDYVLQKNKGGNYGGFMEYEENDEHYRVTRYFGKTPQEDRYELLNLDTNRNTELGVEV